MSGPVRAADLADELLVARATEVGGVPVRRLLPKRTRRTIGAWCFVDHLGPTEADMQIGPHPHIGLHTVTWLLDGEVLHRDSLGSEQLVRPGQLNVMTAGHGIAHAEEGRRRPSHGVQLWVAQPEATRHGDPAFEHHPSLPTAELGALAATVLVGEVADARSPARADTPLVGAELRARRGSAVVPLDPAFEHGVIVLDGELIVDGRPVQPGTLAYLATGRTELPVEADADAVALLVGGTPFESNVVLWWNFVARTPAEIDAARAAWNSAEADRFGSVASPLRRIPAPER